MKNDIILALQTRFETSEIRIEDDSQKHKGHAGNPQNATENTHLRLYIKSPLFNDKTRLERHRMVNAVMEPFFDSGLHALQIFAEPA